MSKEGLHALSDTSRSILEVIRLLISLKMTLLDADVLICSAGLEVFTSSEVSKASLPNDCHIHLHLHHLCGLGFLHVTGKRKTGKREAKLYALTDSGCALVARLSAIIRGEVARTCSGG